jgi:hypothetical protein
MVIEEVLDDLGINLLVRMEAVNVLSRIGFLKKSNAKRQLDVVSSCARH